MNDATRRGRPGSALRLLALAASLVWLLSGALAGEHHHHALGAAEPVRSDACAACTLAHAPALEAAPAPVPAPARIVPGVPATAPPVAPAPPPRAIPDPRGPPAA